MLSDWVREALEFSGLSGAELGRRLSATLGRNFDRAAINKMQVPAAREQKTRNIQGDELLAIADITGYPLPVDPAKRVRLVPVISWVSAGKLGPVEPVHEQAIVTRKPVAGLPSGDWIALEVTGDSMNLVAPPGAILCVDRTERKLLHERFYVIQTGVGDTTFKRYRANPDRFQPYSNNPDHETWYPDRDYSVLGRVRRVITEL